MTMIAVRTTVTVVAGTRLFVSMVTRMVRRWECPVGGLFSGDAYNAACEAPDHVQDMADDLK